MEQGFEEITSANQTEGNAKYVKNYRVQTDLLEMGVFEFYHPRTLYDKTT